MNEDFWEKPTEWLERILQEEKDFIEVVERGSFGASIYREQAANNRIQLILRILESRKESAVVQ